MSEFNKEVFLQNLKEVNTVLKQIHICIDNIVKLSNDMAGADSEINEAILQLQQNVITINGTLTTHGQDITAINNALANKMYKVIEVSDSATSGTFTEEQYSQIINDKSVVIKYGSGLYYREFEYTLDNDFIRFRHLNTLSVSLNVITASSQYITVPKSTNAWTYTSNSDIKFYNQNYIDTYIQYKLTSGTNIKTINGESVLGSGDMTVGGGFELIWTNSNPVSMQETTISITNLSQYNFIIVEFYEYLGNDIFNFGIFKVDDIQSYLETYGGLTFLTHRKITINKTNNSITFSGGNARPFSNISNLNSDNKVCLPYKIYGIK